MVECGCVVELVECVGVVFVDVVVESECGCVVVYVLVEVCLCG